MIKRTSRLTIMVTDAEYKKLRLRAAQSNTTVSSYGYELLNSLTQHFSFLPVFGPESGQNESETGIMEQPA